MFVATHAAIKGEMFDDPETLRSSLPTGLQSDTDSVYLKLRGCGEHHLCCPELCPLAHYYLRVEPVLAALKYQPSRLQEHDFVRSRWRGEQRGLTKAQFDVYRALTAGMLKAEQWDKAPGRERYHYPDNLSVPRRDRPRMWAYGESVRKLAKSAHSTTNTVITGLEQCRNLGVVANASLVRLKETQKRYVRTEHGFAKDPHRKQWISRAAPVEPPDYYCLPILSPLDLLFISRDILRLDISYARNARLSKDKEQRLLRDKKMNRPSSPSWTACTFNFEPYQGEELLSLPMGAGEEHLVVRLKEALDEGSVHNAREGLNALESELLGFQDRSNTPIGMDVSAVHLR
jgi:hypothetical protein